VREQRRAEHHLAHRAAGRRAQQALGPQHVDAQRKLRVEPRARVLLGCEVEQHVAATQQGRELERLGQIDREQLRLARAACRRLPFGDARRTIEHAHALRPAGEQALGQVTADEAGATGDDAARSLEVSMPPDAGQSRGHERIIAAS
jgi:hypothetical protein